MENASKALLIAGAILICILLIAIGMYVYNAASETINSAASKMSQQDKDIYNSDVKQYEGATVKGSEIKSMIETITSKNQGNVNQSGKFISIGVAAGVVQNYSGNDALANACNTCNAFDLDDDDDAKSASLGTGAGKNDETNVGSATKEMNTLKAKINPNKTYKVVSVKKEGIIVAMIIESK